MNIKNNINQAEILYKKGMYQESLDICDKLLEKKPNLFNALQIKALNYQATGNLKNALILFEKAISIKPQHASTYNNIGNIYLSYNDFRKASKSYIKALSIESLMPEALNNLATCQVELNDNLSAVANYKKAILLDPLKAEFQLNLGILLTDDGDFAQAQEYLMNSLSLDQSITSVYWQIFKIQIYSHRYQDAIEVANMAIMSQSLPEHELCELLVGRAIIFWLFYNFDEASQSIELSQKIYEFEHLSENIVNMAIFHRYIKKLLVIRNARTELYLPKKTNEVKEIYFISESHGFAPNGVIVEYNKEEYQIRSLFVLGAKIFHLISKNENKYQVSLASLLDGLTPGSKVVLGFGEIDCRNNEGIYAYCLKSGEEPKKVIDNMLVKYVDTLKAIAEHYHLEIILYGVPAPHPYHVNSLVKEEQQVFKDVISYFNESLKKVCKLNKVNLLDVYLLTNEHGQSNMKYHIDSIHLAPDVVPELFLLQ
ncbi:tetratricopeptide repeat protein [Pseudocolwellia agarivorans]|uniref:tetratricopeptide repeat protein n=1 Tax=Pseudocolwellia agarivorans TaxID=1911682 RepID=UPI003F882604